MKSLVALVIAIALAWGTTQWIYAGVETAASQSREPLPVAVVHFDVEDQYARHSSYVGTIKAGRDSTIGFEVGGTLATMPAREGMQVGAGSIIATLDIDRRLAQLRAAEAELERINADLELAKRKRERFEDLVNRGLTSRQQFDEVQLGEQALAQARMASRARRDSAALDVEKKHPSGAFPGGHRPTVCPGGHGGCSRHTGASASGAVGIRSPYRRADPGRQPPHPRQLLLVAPG